VGARSPSKPPHSLSPEPEAPWGPRRRRARPGGRRLPDLAKAPPAAEAGRVVNTAKEGIFTTCRAGSVGPAGPGSLPGAPAAEKWTCSLGPRKGWGVQALLLPQFPEGLVSGFPGQRSPRLSPPGPSLNPHSRGRPGCIPSSATLWLRPPKCDTPAPALAPGLQGPFVQCCVQLGMGAKVREESGGCPQGAWSWHVDDRARGSRGAPRPPKLLHGGCAKTP